MKNKVWWALGALALAGAVILGTRVGIAPHNPRIV